MFMFFLDTKKCERKAAMNEIQVSHESQTKIMKVAPSAEGERPHTYHTTATPHF